MTTDTPTLSTRRNGATAPARGVAPAVRKGARWIAPTKVAVFIAAWYPLARLVIYGFTDRLGADPVRFVTWSTGLWTLVFLCITLAVTPLRAMTGINALLRFRRMLGLYAFFYATLHFITYIWFDKWFDLAEIVKDIGKRPFITVGFAAFVLMSALAATSPRAAARKLGRRWLTLHRAIYAIAALAILHFWWMKASKHDLLLPKVYGAIVVALLAWRLGAWLWAKRAAGRRARV